MQTNELKIGEFDAVKGEIDVERGEFGGDFGYQKVNFFCKIVMIVCNNYIHIVQNVQEATKIVETSVALLT